MGKLTMEWVLFEDNGATKTFYEEHEAILLNMYYQLYYSGNSSGHKEEYRFVEISDRPSHFVDMKNLVEIDVEAYASGDLEASIKKVE